MPAAININPMSKVVKILDAVHGVGPCVAAIACDHPEAPAYARQLRDAVARFIREAAQGTLPLQSPPPQPAGTARGAGHMHLHAEVFLQMAGQTRFTFPHGQLALTPGQVLVVPPKLLHDEWVSGHEAQAFCNLVISADSQRMSCHLAHEVRPGVPASLYLETCQHPDAMRIEGWLRDGQLQRLDLAFSRDAAPAYVQDRLREAGDELRRWVDDGAAIYVCGSLQGMAPAVHATLIDLLGADTVETLAEQRRYRRDVY